MQATPFFPDKARLLREAAPHRAKWGQYADNTGPAEVTPEAVGPGDESVWGYPRPPELRPASAPARVVFAGRDIAASADALRVVETAGAPVYYFPPDAVDMAALEPSDIISVCEWKGAAAHFHINAGGRCAENAAFAYPDPFDDLGRGFARIAGWVGFYPARVDACYVGDERATPQPGGVYAGWVTKNIKGPVKGAPGTEHW